MHGRRSHGVSGGLVPPCMRGRNGGCAPSRWGRERTRGTSPECMHSCIACWGSIPCMPKVSLVGANATLKSSSVSPLCLLSSNGDYSISISSKLQRSSCSRRLHPSFLSLDRVNGEWSEKNNTVPCPKLNYLDVND